MIPGFNDSTAPTIPRRSTAPTIPRRSSATDPWQTNSTASSWDVIPVAPRTEREESEDLKAFKKALLDDQRALRTLRDPSPRVSFQARKGLSGRLSGRQAVRKRVCSSSSRYRVLVN